MRFEQVQQDGLLVLRLGRREINYVCECITFPLISKLISGKIIQCQKNQDKDFIQKVCSLYPPQESPLFEEENQKAFEEDKTVEVIVGAGSNNVETTKDAEITKMSYWASKDGSKERIYVKAKVFETNEPFEYFIHLPSGHRFYTKGKEPSKSIHFSHLIPEEMKMLKVSSEEEILSFKASVEKP